MNHQLKTVLKLILLFLLLFPNLASAWDWDTHPALVEKFYYSIPLNVRNNLNLSAMEIGSIAPDKDFHDNVLHNYPPSLKLSKKWLALAKESYLKNDFYNSSYAFGVASHYISDSFVAPHYTFKEDPKLHSKFEKGRVPYSSCEKRDYDLNYSLYLASLNQKDWDAWLETKDDSIPQKEVDQAMKLIYSVGLDLFETSCNEQTLISYKDYFPGFKTILIGVLILMLIGYLVVGWFKS